MSARGYKTIVEKYYMKELQKQSGLGRKADGTVSTPDWWWKQNAKLEEMFHDVVVDGSTSYVVGVEEKEEQDGEDVEEEDAEQDGLFHDFEDSPISNNNRKRGSSNSTRSTTTSLGKKSKSPMLKMMTTLVDKLTTSKDTNDNIFRNVGKTLATTINEKRQKLTKMQEMAQSVKKCQELALECGATPETVEFYAGRHLFKDPYEREFFSNIPMAEPLNLNKLKCA
uniref:Myb/SANT-like domain-containing protein n=1 Tax=Setaria viridis TaxID=4556 RepID=A0A4U6W8L1_SETVI|nr:hypothetical protein SEVIR_1G151200v2 [Setaria viridis]